MSTEPELNRITVLAVDDVEDNLDLLEDMLVDQVRSFTRARSGEEAIRLATEHRPDVMLLDLMMPRMNGLSVIRTFRNTRALQETAIIVQTAYADNEAVLTARRLGCNHVLTKPVCRERLLTELRMCLSRRPARPSPRRADTRAEVGARPVEERRHRLEDARRRLDIERPHICPEADDTSSEIDDRLRRLIDADSTIGRKLIRLANSSVYPGRYPVRNVTEAIVRVGVRETKALVRKTLTQSAQGENLERTLKALDLLENVIVLFPDRAATNEGILALLADLNKSSTPAVDESGTRLQDSQAPPCADATKGNVS